MGPLDDGQTNSGDMLYTWTYYMPLAEGESISTGKSIYDQMNYIYIYIIIYFLFYFHTSFFLLFCPVCEGDIQVDGFQEKKGTKKGTKGMKEGAEGDNNYCSASVVPHTYTQK
jgi:hypothetical protein